MESIERREDRMEKRKTKEILTEDTEEDGIADERQGRTNGRKKRRINDGRDSTVSN